MFFTLRTASIVINAASGTTKKRGTLQAEYLRDHKYQEFAWGQSANVRF